MSPAALLLGALLQLSPPWALFTQTASGGAPDFTLPDATTNEGRVVMVKVLPTASATIVRAGGSQLIDNQPTYTVPVGGSSAFQSEAGAWRVVTNISIGGSGSTPTGTGYRHVTGGVEDAAAVSPIPFSEGGTGLTTALDDQTLVSSGVGWVAKTLPDTFVTAGLALGYRAGANTFITELVYQIVQDEGVAATQRSTVNFVGAGVTCADNGGTSVTDCTIPGGAGSVETTINLGTAGGLVFTATVVGQTWVAADTEIVCTPFGTTADGLTPETVIAAGLSVSTSAKVVGTGFDLSVYSPHGLTGTLRVHCIGT